MEVLFHELVHATTRYPDNNRNFENELGSIIGKLSVELISSKYKDDQTLTMCVASSTKNDGTPRTATNSNTIPKQIPDKVDKRHFLFGKRIK